MEKSDTINKGSLTANLKTLKSKSSDEYDRHFSNAKYTIPWYGILLVLWMYKIDGL